MNYIEIFIEALTALKGNLLRTSLTMLGIIIGIMSVILIISLGQGATASITNQVSSLGSNLIIVTPGSGQARGPIQTGNVTSLKLSDLQAIKDKSQIQNIGAASGVVSRKLQVVANGQNANITIQAVSADYQSIQSIDIDQGIFFTSDDENGWTRVAVVGPQVVTDLFGEGTQVVGQPITIDKKSFRIIGVTKAKGSSGFSNPDETIYIPLTTGMKIVFGQDYLQDIQADAIDATQLDQTIADTKQLLLDKHKITDLAQIDFSIQSSKDILNTVNSITGILTAMLASIAGISLLVGGIGIMNIMLVTVTERTKEIGLLKAIGAKHKDILTQFLIEAIVLTLSGGLTGMALGIGIAFLLSHLLSIPFIVQGSSILLAVGVSTVVGVIFGLYPAQRAARLSPIDALRYE